MKNDEEYESRYKQKDNSKPLREGVRSWIRNQNERNKTEDKGSYLFDALKFNLNLYLSDSHKKTAQVLFDSLELSTGYKLDVKFKAFEIFLSNLLLQTKKPVRISLNTNSWTKSRYNPYPISYQTVKEFVKVFDENKLINMNKGYHTEKESRETRIEATQELLDIFPEYKSGVFSKPVELVILRDKRKNNIDYTDTYETRRIRAILTAVNEVNSKADIRYHSYKLNPNLVAIFIERFTLYGRLHTTGYRHYQGHSGEERKEFTINGDSVIEVDYNSLHPNLLYAAEGIQFEGDPYRVIDNRPEVRLFLKIILLCMINSKDFNEAQKGANYWLINHRKEQKKLKALGITRAAPLINEFMEKHKPISHYLCSGNNIGLKLMNKDSKIALDVIHYFAKQNKPILCVHDSFIVQSQLGHELSSIMKSTYFKHTGFSIKIK